MEKAWFYEILFFQVVLVIVKDKKKNALQKIQCQSKLVLFITGIALHEQEKRFQ